MWFSCATIGVVTSTPNPSCGRISNNSSDVSVVDPPSLVPIHILDHTLDDVGANEDQIRFSRKNISSDGLSLYVIEPTDECACTKEKLSKKQKDTTYTKEKKLDFTSENYMFPGGSPGPASLDGSIASDVESLRNKLLATMQILENKEETIRVQAQSLAFAEARIAELVSRSKSSGLQSPKSSGADSSPVTKVDCSINTSFHQGNHHEKIVATLQDSLSVIEELYKECFYETAKQDELINTLRDSFAEVRLMEREKTEQIGRMQNALNAQKWSLDRRQDIAMEVESLKSEISNYLNSNQDSGMWERDEAAEMRDSRRRDASHSRTIDCICGLKEENNELRQANENLEVQSAELRKRVQKLETALQDKCRENVHCLQQLQLKEQEYRSMSQRLVQVEQGSREQAATIDALEQKMQQQQILLTEKSAQLLQVRQHCESRQSTVAELSRQLDEARHVIEQEREGCEKARREAQEACVWRERCRERTSSMSQLKAQLLDAQSKSARLCADTQALLGALRAGMQRYKRRVHEQEAIINQQDALIRSIKGCNQDAPCYDSPSCSRYITSERNDCPVRSCTKCSLSGRRSDMDRDIGCSKCAQCNEREVDAERTSGSEVATRLLPPKPPKRHLRKKKTPQDDSTWSRDAAAQRPERCDAIIGTCSRSRSTLRCSRCVPAVVCRELCDAEKLLERVSGTREALRSSHRRWSRQAHCHPHPHSHSSASSHTRSSHGHD